MSDKITFGVTAGNRRVPVKGRPAMDEFELASALYALLQEASANGELAEGGVKGAIVGEPRLLQGMNYQSLNIPVTIDGREFRITVKPEQG